MRKLLTYIDYKFSASTWGSRHTMIGVFDSYRDLLDYNKRRQTMCSQYTTNLVAEYYSETGVAQAAEGNMGSKRKQWVGTTNWKEALEEIWTFINIKALNKALAGFQSRTTEITTVGFAQRKKLYLNDLYKGVFSFDLASPYIYPKKEFYSPLFKQEVGSEKVKSEGVEPNLKFIYDGDPVHELEQRDTYDSDGNKIFTSSYERAKAYIDLPKPKKEGFTVDLFVISTYSYNIEADDLVWNALAVNAVAKTIYDSGIQVRVWSITPLEIEQAYSMALITKLKDYDEALDENAISIVAADPRFYRIHSFRCRSYLADDLGTPEAMGRGMGKSQKDEENAKRVMLKAFKELEIYDDPVTQKIYEDNKIFIRQCLSEQAGVNEYKRIMEYFEDYADYRTIGIGTDFKTFQEWKSNKKRFNSQETYDEYLQKNKITRST